MLNILLNILGILFIIYGVAALRENFRRDEETKIGEFKDYIEEVKNFQNVLENEQDKLDGLEEGIEDFKEGSFLDLNPNLKSGQNIGKNKSGHTSLVRDVKHEKIDDNISDSFISQRIISMANIGLSSEEIAKETQKSVREIEVILKVNKKN